MAGHNKWSKIKRQKEKSDAEKSRVFGKLVRTISLEAKKSGGNIKSPVLRAAIEKAREANVPSENIERAIRKGKEGESNLEEIIYEAYGPGGTALLILCLTSNRNKSAQEVKHVLTKYGFDLAKPGSASWAFEKKEEEWTPAVSVEISETQGEVLSNLIDSLCALDEVEDVLANAK